MFNENTMVEFFEVLKDEDLCDDCWMDNGAKMLAQWKITWSDRVVNACDVHVADAIRAYNGDHEYDKIDLTFTEITGDVDE